MVTVPMRVDLSFFGKTEWQLGRVQVQRVVTCSQGGHRVALDFPREASPSDASLEPGHELAGPDLGPRIHTGQMTGTPSSSRMRALMP